MFMTRSSYLSHIPVRLYLNADIDCDLYIGYYWLVLFFWSALDCLWRYIKHVNINIVNVTSMD